MSGGSSVNPGRSSAEMRRKADHAASPIVTVRPLPRQMASTLRGLVSHVLTPSAHRSHSIASFPHAKTHNKIVDK